MLINILRKKIPGLIFITEKLGVANFLILLLKKFLLK